MARKADAVAWEQWPGKTLEGIRAEIWESPQGVRLYKLARNRGKEAYYQARVRKSAEDRAAWDVLEEVNPTNPVNCDGVSVVIPALSGMPLGLL